MQYQRSIPLGISLAEVVICLSVIAIIVVAAYPSYIEYSLRNKLADATSILIQLRYTLETYYQNEQSYLDHADQSCALKSVSTAFFDFTCSEASEQRYTITASNKPHAQLGIGGRFEFSIDQDGHRKTIAFAGSLVNTDCWMSSRNGC
jgi:Tfp pilus assembly protein PilE